VLCTVSDQADEFTDGARRKTMASKVVRNGPKSPGSKAKDKLLISVYLQIVSSIFKSRDIRAPLQSLQELF
jgi:hypothetical protein